jgi:hypothetical protein
MPGSASNLIELCVAPRACSRKFPRASRPHVPLSYAFLVSMHCDRKEWHLLKANLERAGAIMASVTGNGTDIALIRECEGVLYSEKKMWNLAFSKFHESFTKYCESNHEKRIDVLMTCMVVGCLTDRSTDEAERAEKMEDMPEVKSLMQVTDNNYNP